MWTETDWGCVELPAIIREVWDVTPGSDRGLRDVVLALIANHADYLIKNDDFHVFLEGSSELGLGLSRQLLDMQS